MALPKTIPELIAELHKSYKATKVADEKDREEFVEAGLRELKSLHEAISQSYDALKIKALALLAGEVAIVTFLFANTPANPPVHHSNHIVYAAIFYLIGVLLLSFAFLLFLYVITPIPWRQPPETKVIKNMDEWFGSNKEKFLRHMRDEYLDAISVCEKLLAGKAKAFILAIYLLSIGILTIVLLKYGRGTINL